MLEIKERNELEKDLPGTPDAMVYKIIMKTTQMINPGPTRTFVMLDERDDSINDGWFAVYMNTFDPYLPNQLQIADYPSSYHNGAGGFYFADGHSEIHKWRDPRTNPHHQDGVHLNTLGTASPGNMDVRWLQERTTCKK